MPSASYDFSPNDIVWVMDTETGSIRQATCIQVDIRVLADTYDPPSATTRQVTNYRVQFDSAEPASESVSADSLFATYDAASTALADYYEV